MNRVGNDPNNAFGGQSQVVDPFGERLLKLDDQPQVGIVTIDLDRIAAARQQIPVFTDRLGLVRQNLSDKLART